MAKSKSKHKPEQNPPTTRISVIIITDKSILLVKHRKGSKQYWVLPGGRLEYGETFEECGVRELKEETGLDVAITGYLFLSEAIAPDRSRHIVNIYLKAKVVGGIMKLGDEPVLAGVEFIPLADLNKITLFPPVVEAIRSSLAGSGAKNIQYLGNLWV